MQHTKNGNMSSMQGLWQMGRLEISRNILTKSRSLIIALMIFCALAITIPNAYAATIAWVNCPCSLNDGTADPSGLGSRIPVVRVNDAAANTNAATKQTVQVTVTSSVDSTGIILTLEETGVNTGIFENTNLALMSGNDIISSSGTVTVTIVDTTSPSPLQQTINSDQSIIILSDTDTFGITPIFTETSPTSNTYTATIRFGAVTDSATNTLAVSAGDFVTVDDTTGGNRANSMISPNPSGFKGAIAAAENQAVTATYAGLAPVSFNVSPYPGGGRGGGGVVAPSLVVDLIAVFSGGNGNGCLGDCAPPTLGLDSLNNRLVNNGFSYNGVPIDAELFYTHYPLIKTTVGKENNVTLKIYDNEGIQNIKHVEMVFGLAKGQVLDDSKAAIMLDRTSNKFNVTKTDPENVLENIYYTNSTAQCGIYMTDDCLVVTIFHTFRAPLDFNIVATEVWDGNRNSWQNYFNDGVEITGQSLNPPPEHIGIYNGHQIRLIETGRNTAVDAEGNTWTFNKEWAMDYKPPKRIEVLTSHGYDRYDDEFQIYKESQKSLAQLTMEKILAGKQIHDELSEIPKTITFGYTARQDKNDLQLAKMIETLRANETLKKMFSVYHTTDD